MVMLQDIRPVSEFVRDTRASIRRLGKTGRPEVLTVNGKARVVVQDAAAYERLLNELEETKTAAAIGAAERGEGIPMKEAFAMVRKRVADGRKK